MKRFAWRVVALLFVLLGAIGVVVPGLPTVPFLLLAAWAGAHGWPALEAKLLAHPRYGPQIRLWREQRAVPRRAKYAAVVVMSISVVLIVFSAAPLWVKIGVPCCLVITGSWLCSRPEPK